MSAHTTSVSETAPSPQAAFTQGSVLRVQLNEGRLLRGLALVVAVLVAMNLLLQPAVVPLPKFPGHEPLRTLFDLNGESNLPATYSALLLGLACALLWVLRAFGTRVDRPGWTLLAGLFAYLTLDEAVQLHERLMQPMGRLIRDVPVLHFGWVVPYAVLVVGALLLLLPLLRRLPRRTALGMVLAGGLYVLGALGFEMAEGVVAAGGGEDSALMAVFITVEEALEMAGVIVLIGVLLAYLRAQTPRARVEVALAPSGGRSGSQS